MSAILVGVVMGSNSDWDVMQRAAEVLRDFGVPFEHKVVSAHRTPDAMFEYAETARERGLKCIIAGAGGAGAPARHDCQQDHAAGVGRAGAIQASRRSGFALLHRANARGIPCSDVRHRRSWRRQCGLVRVSLPPTKMHRWPRAWLEYREKPQGSG